MDTELAAAEMKQPTAPELQMNGISGLLEEDYANRWDYLFAHIDDLMPSDVKKLLFLYKRHVLQRLVLSKGSRDPPYKQFWRAVCRNAGSAQFPEEDVFIVRLSKNAPDPEVDSNAVQDFLASMEDALRIHLLLAGGSEEELENASEDLEKFVMTKLYDRVFAAVQEDARGDEDLFQKMSLLQHFILPENLNIKLEFQNESSWLEAQMELQKINLYKAPRDKLACILNCCKVINNLVVNAPLASGQKLPGDDEFLHVLIYIMIKANPPQLHLNLQYIQRFRRRTRLVSESACFFTKILSAESFVRNINGEAFEAEFQRKMNAAREHLLWLSTPSRPSDSERFCSENSQTQVDGTSDLEIKQPTDPELQKKGIFGLLEEDNVDRGDYPYLFAHAGDLTGSDVKELLVLYKRLIAHCLVLKGVVG